ncbi:hypothetical protein N431DRAFT_462444 [Stipitochalara longipes BDJ]|nr:hypothetical protein N431DRAFT_462444 [Stipitochalara longipes BDJ]
MSTMEQDLVLEISGLKPLEQFTFFPKLAVEIRLKVWKYALPIGPQGLRLLKVAGDEVVETTRSTKRIRIQSSSNVIASTGPSTYSETTSSHLTFRLLKHHHNVDIKNCSLLSACLESRQVYLKYFNQSLRVGEEGLIRFAKEDIVYISNMDFLLSHGDFLLKLMSRDSFQGINCQKLALPSPYFLLAYRHYSISGLNYPMSYTGSRDEEVLALILHSKELREIGVVANDWDYMLGEWSEEEIANLGADLVAKSEESCAEECLKGRDEVKQLRIWDMGGNEMKYLPQLNKPTSVHYKHPEHSKNKSAWDRASIRVPHT